MAVAPGTRIGPYDISAQIGVGGMGEVYRATDTNLGRQVAIKVLPDAVAQDAERLARFDREARTLATLNHPGIAQIYGVEKQDGQTALVMELVEGPTLADRIVQGAIPVDEVLPIAKQIAEALEAAHEQGIIHRDLKPANIKVRPDGTVKVLDFGLAKAMEGGGSQDPAFAQTSQLPTITTPAMTQMGMILGTAAYMSPEQAKGRPADRRSDVWAFGAVLYEMLTGQRAFKGDDVSDTMASVLKADTDWAVFPESVPLRVITVIKRCLQRDPKQRLDSVQDLRLVLDGAFETVPAVGDDQSSRFSAWRLALQIAVTAVVVSALTAWLTTERASDAPAVTRFVVPLPSDQVFTSTEYTVVAVSPDGRRLAYVANNQLYVRDLGEPDTRLVSGTENVAPRGVAFSPDGEWLAYYSQIRRAIVRVPWNGGIPLVIALLPPSAVWAWGLSWDVSDTLLWADEEGIWRAPGAGGETEQLVETERGRERADTPQLLPDGDHVLFALAGLSGSDRWDKASIVVQSLRSGERTVVWQGGKAPQYLSSGHLLFAQGEVLLATRLDPETFEISGTPMQVVSGVQTGRLPHVVGSGQQFRVSAQGTLVYVEDTTGGMTSDRSLVWVDRDGRETPLPELPDAYRDPRISPDGGRVAVTIDDDSGNPDVWVLDLSRGTRVRLTFDAAQDRYPLWSPDGRFVLFSSQRKGPAAAVYRKAADGSGTEEPVVSVPDRTLVPWSWSADGRTLLLSEYALTGNTGFDIGAFALDGGGSWMPLLQEPATEAQPSLSSDGRWMLFQANMSGKNEVYVRPFPDVASGLNIVSVGGGSNPFWSPTGREIFYRNGNSMMAAPVETASSFQAGPPVELFQGRYFDEVGRQWDPSPEGDRFLVIKAAGARPDESSALGVNVVQNWFTELERLLPTK